MRKLILVVTLVAITTCPALAQSHDPSIGSGNIDRTVITAPLGTVSREPSTSQPRASRIMGPHTHEIES